MKVLCLLLLAVYVSAETYEQRAVREGYLGDQGDWVGVLHEQFLGWPIEKLRTLLGAKLDDSWMARAPEKPAYLYAQENNMAIPYSGNWQISNNSAWANCKKTFAHIKDQADCGSCWAVAASEVVEDRTCIMNVAGVPANKVVEFSAADLMDCCTYCGDGCQGGYPIDAMRFWYMSGVVTGGQYGSNCGCKPYQIPPCKNDNCKGPIAQTPACTKTCRPGYNTAYLQDKHKATDHYRISRRVKKLQEEIYNHGTIECAFEVHSSFFGYKSGVYTSCSGPLDGGHAITLVGWGTQQSIDYWLVKNSWNASWGLQGYIKMKRGINLCGIEEQCVAGKATTNQNNIVLTC